MESLNHRPKVTQLTSGSTRIPPQICLTPKRNCVITWWRQHPHALCVSSLTVPPAPACLVFDFAFRQPLALEGIRVHCPGHGCECVCAGGQRCECTHSLRLDSTLLKRTLFPLRVSHGHATGDDGGKCNGSGSFGDHLTGPSNPQHIPNLEWK